MAFRVLDGLHGNCEHSKTHPVQIEALIMKVVHDPQSAVTIRHVEPGAITVGDEVINKDVVLMHDGILRDWQAKDIRNLALEDLADVLARKPEIILFGTGWQSQLPPRELVFALARQGIGLETMDTPAACRTFNILLGEDREVAAVLIIEQQRIE